MSIKPTNRVLSRTLPLLVGLPLLCLGLIRCGGGGPTDGGGTTAINISPNSISFSTAPGGAVEPKTVGITPATSDLTGLTATSAFVGTPPSEWLAASLGSSQASLVNPAILTLQVTNSNLPAGTYKAVVTIQGAGAGNSPKVNVTLTVEAAAALTIVTQPSATAVSGATLAAAPVVQLQTADGVAVAQAGVNVTVALEGAGSLVGAATATTDATGKATFDGLGVNGPAGEHTLLFTAQGLTEVRSNPIVITAGGATTIAAGSVTPQSAETSTPANDPPIALVTDAAGNPVAGVAVTFAVTQGNGTIDPTTPVTTNADGLAALNSWTMGPVAGANAVTASATGLTGSPVEFDATGTNGGVVPGPVDGSKSSVAVAPSSLVAGVNGTITVTARDAANNLIGGATVTVTSNGTGNTFGSTTLTTGTSGLTLGKATTTFSSTKAEAKSITAQITANAITASPGPAAVTVVAGAPSATTSTVSGPTPVVGLANGSLVTVTVKDANGNPVSGRNVTLAIASGPGGEVLTQPGSSTGAGGSTTGTLKSTTGGVYNVQATIDGVTVVTQTAAIQILLSFAADIQTGIFDTPFNLGGAGTTTPCNSCHLPDGSGNDPDLRYSEITLTHDGDPVAVSGNAGVSRLFRAVNQDPTDTELNPATEWMPSSTQRLPDAVILKIRRWINQNGDGGTLQP